MLGLPSASSAQSAAPTAGPRRPLRPRQRLLRAALQLRRQGGGQVRRRLRRHLAAGAGRRAVLPSRPPRWARTCSTGGRATTWPATPPATWCRRADSGPDADWTVTVQGNSFRLALGDRVLSVDGAGRLVLTGAPGPGSQFSMEKASGCAEFPEVETGVTGAPSKGSTPYTETAGFLDAHMHGMAFEFLGGTRALRQAVEPLRGREGAGRLPRPRQAGGGAARRWRTCSRTATRRAPRPHRLAHLQGLAGGQVADPRAELLQVARALVAGGPAGVREPAGREQGAVRGLPVQAELLRRDELRPPPGAADARDGELHRRAGRRARARASTGS